MICAAFNRSHMKSVVFTSVSTDRISRARQRLEAKLIKRIGWDGYTQLKPQLRELENAVRAAEGIDPLPPVDTTPETVPLFPDHECPEPAWGISPNVWRRLSPAARQQVVSLPPLGV